MSHPNTDPCRSRGAPCRLAALDCADRNDRLDLARFAEALRAERPADFDAFFADCDMSALREVSL